MTNLTPPPTGLSALLGPFGRRPCRWETERLHAARGGHVCRDDVACTDGCERLPLVNFCRRPCGALTWAPQVTPNSGCHA
ncbi:hypothetical protein [Streptomyces himalayensis]|uniref:Uncharacterized protein n=1 Tax=Streptomyces himalayensis subsp. himalayensis TaxID=2756131 RepID=A0A7W0IBY4_9ACTN|nr:hypothetical protein [Streptomyces himalayensis]MBA2949611.1 hypothetical protein [Streptomyces himalayensis subsp. himalayensis]